MNFLHFCSGLPRTGSTVLMNILQQNPYIFTTGTCALPGLIKEHILLKSRYREAFQAMSTDQADMAMYGFVRKGTQGWFQGLTDKPVVISKNRQWSDIHYLYPESKFIACVRDLRDIVESFEKINNKINALSSFGDAGVLYSCMTEKEKYNYFFNEMNALSGSLYQELPRLMDMFKKDNTKVKFIRYEDFLKNPVQTLNEIYSFLNLNSFNHDLNNIQQSELFEHDHAYFRERTSHKVQKNIISWKDPIRVLSNDFHSSVIENNKWYYESFYPEVLHNEY